MRLVISSLILAAGLAGAAQAQDVAPPAPAATTPAAPVQINPAPPPPAAQPAPAPAAEAAPPPPTVPTTGDGAVVLSVLERVCVPMVRGGQKLDTLAKPLGMKLNKREGTWSMPLGGDKAYQVIVYPSGANPDVCRADVRFAIGQDAPITSALNIWSFVQNPPLDPTANYTQPQDPDGLKRVRRSWEALSPTSSTAVNFSTVRKPDDTPLARNYDTGNLIFQERKF